MAPVRNSPKYFGGNVEFAAGIDELTFNNAANDLKIVSADPHLNKLLVAHCEEALSRRSAKRGSFRAAVENAIVPLLPHGKAHAAEIARKLGLSQRTSARRLSSEGLSFSQVLEDLRSDLAKQYLLDQGLMVSRIAWLLGFQEVSAFTHAFKRWTGKTPREVRAAPSWRRGSITSRRIQQPACYNLRGAAGTITVSNCGRICIGAVRSTSAPCSPARTSASTSAL